MASLRETVKRENKNVFKISVQSVPLILLKIMKISLAQLISLRWKRESDQTCFCLERLV